MYKITDYSYKKAKELGVEIKPSKSKNKKIDVYKNNNKIASVGAIGYNDYPTYIKEKGLEYANKRKKLYHERHKHDNKPNGKYAKAEKPLKTQKNGYPGVGYTCGPEFIIPKTFKFYLL